MKNILLQIRLLSEYIIVHFLFIILYFLPINFVSKIGGILFRIFGPFTKSHKIAINNYKKVFATTSSKEAKNMVMQSWDNLGKTVFELSILNKIVNTKNKKISIRGLENLESLIKKKQQLIFFTIHQSNWEILPSVFDKIGFNVGVIYRHINNKYINKLVLYKRNQSISSKNSFYTPKGKQSAKDILEAINKKSSIFLLIDQKDSAGEKIKLFNYDAKTQTGFLKIAKKYNLKLIPVQNIRHGINDFIVKFHPPLSNFEKNISNDQTMLTIHKIIEKWILENPSQWLWQHNRFS